MINMRAKQKFYFGLILLMFITRRDNTMETREVGGKRTSRSTPLPFYE